MNLLYQMTEDNKLILSWPWLLNLSASHTNASTSVAEPPRTHPRLPEPSHQITATQT